MPGKILHKFTYVRGGRGKGGVVGLCRHNPGLCGVSRSSAWPASPVTSGAVLVWRVVAPAKAEERGGRWLCVDEPGPRGGVPGIFHFEFRFLTQNMSLPRRNKFQWKLFYFVLAFFVFFWLNDQYLIIFVSIHCCFFRSFGFNLRSICFFF